MVRYQSLTYVLSLYRASLSLCFNELRPERIIPITIYGSMCFVQSLCAIGKCYHLLAQQVNPDEPLQWALHEMVK